MILLNDEERAEIYNQVLAEGGLDYAPSGDLQDRTAEAQLKKVAEWLADRVSQNWDEGSHQPFGYTISEQDWQALLEEVKE